METSTAPVAAERGYRSSFHSCGIRTRVSIECRAYGEVESLVPAEVPIELLANRVVKRFRQAAGRWPVFQLGPGVFTVNLVPPYNGWGEFQGVLSHGIDLLFLSYPLPDKYLNIREVSLKYIDAFSSKHGYEEMLSFLGDYLSININIPDHIRVIN